MKYPFIVGHAQVYEHEYWVAESLVLRGCVGQGDTRMDACRELEENEAEWLEAAQKYGIDIPPQKDEAIMNEFFT